MTIRIRVRVMVRVEVLEVFVWVTHLARDEFASITV